MTAIRYRHNYRLVTLNEQGPVGKLSVVADTIPARLRSGKLHFAKFAGSIDAKFIGGMQKVKLINIEAWSPDDGVSGNWLEISKGHYVAGVYFNSCYYIVLEDNAPVTFEL
ncbi:hypothetical protein BCU70_21590 [Vibrio sp. 10N.286.49.C2]|uniref:hypothetical protein n=1 Tax=unclassified Vibrio TaxID=2614977 RepID=UPI000C821AD6|nr:MULTISPECIES: hypothetical protein [unclassified Vibrio]PMH30841.1 hypothetical protein BCU70_21590 [Vibrio sp. 10N.286.49.C2]PMH50889.1 hypothetical protein BCU66_17690 [Vibrio sp. 10N.286.49.B1]PMH78957.1 hypothetical protein BCU58_07220 [Vibrio sp. 10N.286.48.B7]